MASTKIINVQKHDSFEEVFAVFKNTDAQEVILIFPKGSRFAKDESHLAAIKAEADRTDKSVSVMSTDPIIAELAVTHGLGLLSQPKSTIVAKSHKLKVAENTEEDDWRPISGNSDQSENKDSESLDEEEPEHVEEAADEILASPVATLAAVRRMPAKKNTSYLNIAKVWASQPPSAPARPKRRRPISKTVAVISGAILLILFLVLYNSLAKAQITIRPKQQTADYQFKITATSNIANVDEDFNKIPGQLLSAQAEASGTYPATGYQNVVQKAGGKITIYNQSATDQRLVATTRFESINGLVFRIPATINIPAHGSAESVVYADRPGVEYNIAPGRFTIPGFKNDPKYNLFYATASTAMTGGFVGPTKIVTDTDYAKAEGELQATVKEKVLKALQNQASGLTVLDSNDIKLTDSAANAKIGEAAEELKLTVNGSAQTLAFREADSMALVRNYLDKAGHWVDIPGKTEIKFQSPTFDSVTKSLTFTVRITGPVAMRVDVDKLTQNVLGLKETAIREYFKGVAEVESAKVILSPFWVRKIPTDKSKIELRIDLN